MGRARAHLPRPPRHLEHQLDLPLLRRSGASRPATIRPTSSGSRCRASARPGTTTTMRFPRSAFHGLRWYELDPSGWLILAMAKVGLAWDVVLHRPRAPAREARRAPSAGRACAPERAWSVRAMSRRAQARSSRACAASRTSGASSSRSPAARALIALAHGGRASAAAAIYAARLSALLGTSTLYHRVDWRPAARRWMRRLDRSMIFVLIAASYTPFALLALHGALASGDPAHRLGGRVGGVPLQLAWRRSPEVGRSSIIASRSAGSRWSRSRSCRDDRLGRDRRADRGGGRRTRPAPSSTRASGRTRGPACSATTRSSTLSSCSPRHSSTA